MHPWNGVLTLRETRLERDDRDAAPEDGDAVRQFIQDTAEARLAPADDAVLVRQLAAFEPEAWSSIFERYFTSVFRLVYMKTRQLSASEDIAAQTFAEAAIGIRGYRYRGVPFRAWLYRIARNLTADYLKKQNRQSHVYLNETQIYDVNPAFDAEIRADLLRAMENLTDDQRNVFLLRFVEGLSLAEVAEVMSKSAGAVKQLQHRALVTLQQGLALDERSAG